MRPEIGRSPAREGLGSGRLARALMALTLGAALVAAPSVGFAAEKAGEVSKESGLGAAAAVSSLVYAPVKLVYAIGGLVVGSLAWAFTAGDSEVAGQVFTRSLLGNYVITPQILTGEEELVFIGRDPDDGPVAAETVAAAEAPTPAYEDPGYDEMGW